MPPVSTFIYGLVDPRTHRIRYIGKANDPERRFGAHWSPSTWDESHRCRWFRQMQATGVRPELVILEEVPYRQWEEAERWWINTLRISHDLVNLTDGGVGVSCSHYPEIARSAGDKRRGRKQPAGTGAKKSATWKIRLAEDAEFREHVSETRRRVSAAHALRPPVHVGEDNPAAKMTSRSAREARERCAVGESGATLAVEYGLSEPSMNALLAGETWQSAGGPLRSRRHLRSTDLLAAIEALLPLKSNKEIAAEFGLEPNAVGVIRYRVKKRVALRHKEAVQ